MKKTIIVLAFVAVVGLGTYFVFAQDRMNGMNENNDMMKNKMMEQQGGQGMMSQGVCPMHMMMCRSMMSKQMAVTEDGGVVVLAGNMVMKFDEELNLVKETELIDMEKMQQKMEKMMENCPIRQKMMNNQNQYQEDSDYLDQF